MCVSDIFHLKFNTICGKIPKIYRRLVYLAIWQSFVGHCFMNRTYTFELKSNFTKYLFKEFHTVGIIIVSEVHHPPVCLRVKRWPDPGQPSVPLQNPPGLQPVGVGTLQFQLLRSGYIKMSVRNLAVSKEASDFVCFSVRILHQYPVYVWHMKKCVIQASQLCPLLNAIIRRGD